jgi:glutamate-1-semialdehyde aminotransferase
VRHPDGIFPLLASHGEGCRLFDAHGRSYVDWMMAWGPVVLGYRHPAVERAIAAQLRDGPLLSLLHPIEVEVAEGLREAIPCAERVAFGKNGSDVLTGAVRVARAVTGREVILCHGYHGFHDWFCAAEPSCQGIPGTLRSLVHRFPYNDLGALEALLARFAGQVAAVVMEPSVLELPKPGFLEGVRRLTREHGCLLVFDEIVTGFRLARGGGQELFGVLPDLACVGKGLANGMPLAALVGNAAVLQRLASTGYGMTYRGETLSLAAAGACLAFFASEPVFARLAETGETVRRRYHETRDRLGVDTTLIGPAARMCFAFAGSRTISPLGQLTLFVQECAKRGVLTNGSLLPCYAHDTEAVEGSLRVFELALEVVARATARERLQDFLHVPPQPAFFRVDI